MNINDNHQTSASQCAQILAYMQKGNKITSLLALQKFGCMRLASRIHDLRDKGHDIKSEKIQVLPSGKYVTEYSINKTTT